MQDAPPPDPVSRDMAAVFDGVRDTRSGGGGRKLMVYPSGVERSRRSLWLRIAAPVLVVMILAGLAAQTGRLGVLPAPPVRTAARIAVRSDPPAPPRPVDERTAAPKTAPAQVDVTDSTGTRSPVALARPSRGPTPLVDRASYRAAATLAAPPAPIGDARPDAEADDCAPGSREDACIYADVLRADRRLRAAYREAAGIGVPADVLAGVTRRWQEARSASVRQPDEAIRRYDRLAALLDDYIAGER